jgi:hypothetical protein
MGKIDVLGPYVNKHWHKQLMRSYYLRILKKEKKESYDDECKEATEKKNQHIEIWSKSDVPEML